MPLKGTLSGGYTAPVTLTSAGYANPVTVTGTISLASAGIDLQAASAWSIFNQGSIEGSGLAGGYGVSLGAGGYVDNAAGGLIHARVGIAIAGAAGTVVNAGAISQGSTGIAAADGGSVTNASGGVLYGFNDGAYFANGGTVTNAAGGSITSADRGLMFEGAAASVVNAGTIVDGSATFGAAVGMYFGGDFSNLDGGQVTGPRGVNVQVGTGTVSNAGTIQGNYGVALGGGGGFTNQAGALVSGGKVGVSVAGGTILNQGSIVGAGSRASAVEFGGGGTVTNEAGVTGGYDGIDTSQGFATVVNTGTVTGSANNGIAVLAGGVVINQPGGTLAGRQDSVYFASAAATGTMVNDGLVTVSAGIGVNLRLPGSVTNSPGGTIEGHSGIYLGAGGTVSNAATALIESRTGQGVLFGDGGGAISNAGTMLNTGTAHSPIEMEAGGSVANLAGGLISGYYHAIDIYGVATVTNAGSIANSDTAKSAVVLASGGTVVNFARGVITGGHHGGYVGGGGTVINAGSIAAGAGNTVAVLFLPGDPNTMIVEPGAVFGGAVDGGNTVGSSIVSTLELAAGGGLLAGIGSSFVNFGAITFDPGAAWSIGGSTAALAGGETIGGFSSGDTIELVGVSETISAFSNGTLSLVGTAPLDLLLPGTVTLFHATQSGGDTDITVACFVAGARILTDAGEVEVERLQVGARVVSVLHRKLLPVVWIGCRKLSAARPVRVRADAFGAGRPHRALWLAPDHAVFVDGALVPVRCLVNGASIAQQPRDEVFYYHVELAEHGVQLAEGLPAESYLDTGNRAGFANRGAVVRPPREKEPVCR